MRNKAFNNFKPSRLRKLMSLAFFALAIPTAVLVYKSYDQLKWEAFYQHRVLAEELSSSIDLKFRDLISTEQRRSFSDYGFATSDANNATLITRSPLSTLPIENASQGVVGFFQIDSNGKFSTPFLPSSLESINQYALAPDDQIQRQVIQDKIEEILSSNQLVEKQSNIIVDTRLDDINSEYEPDNTSFFSKTSALQNQDAFDRLSETKEIGKESDYNKDNVLSRLEELEVSSPYQEKVDLRKRKTQKRTQAKVKNPNFNSDVTAKKESSKKSVEPDTSNISIFENNTDPFEISLLKSGHFVLYRKVWRNDQRYIQGLLIEQNILLNGLIKDGFTNSLLSRMSNLTLIYQGNAIASFSEQRRGSYKSRRDYLGSKTSALSGSLLLRSRLSAPFNQLESVFTIKSLPAGAGAKVILWSALIMILTLIVVIYSLYRLSLRNLSLVNQQQDFVSAVSHELKTPLTSIRMYGEILQQGWADEEKKKTYYSFIFDESERLTRLINNVLELARMTRNETPVTMQAVSVTELIDITRSKVDSQIERAKFKLNIEIDNNAVTKSINIDQDIFAQIVINLIDNALKFSSKAERKEIDLNVKQTSNGKLCFSIRDYGPGIAKDQLKKIFTLFYRSENELTRSTTGTGIGLALVHQSTQLMNGKIDVLNREPGAEFQVFFNTIKN